MKKLIEVALPLEAINKEAAREKSIRHGHPSTLHLWWSRKPLAAARAVLFASLVDDPSGHPDKFPTELDQDRERQRLFKLLEELVRWENSSNRRLLDQALEEITRYTDGRLPTIYDPFCGGGSIPLEAERLGLNAYASDLNPVAVLITKCLIEIPPKYAGRDPINPEGKGKTRAQGLWEGARGLADDVRYYGRKMRDAAFERIGRIYPEISLPKEKGGRTATVIAWIWARTVTCPNPACGARMPLVHSFVLSTNTRESTWVDPVVDPRTKTIHMKLKIGVAPPTEGTVNRRGAKCILCGGLASLDYIRAQGRAGQMGSQLLALVAQGPRGRLYLEATEEHEIAARVSAPKDILNEELSTHPQYMGTPRYGLTRQRDLFTSRQLVTLSTLSDLVAQVRANIVSDGADRNYADSVATYLGLLVSRLANTHSSLALWSPTRDQSKNTFARQALPMAWVFAEVNPFAGAAGDIAATAESLSEAIGLLPARGIGVCTNLDAQTIPTTRRIYCTDPPYYDNIPYSDLSDFFYVWLRKSLSSFAPDLFGTLLTPKASEIVADSHRYGSKVKAQEAFAKAFLEAFLRIRASQDTEYPLTVFYAFKQTESDDDGQSGGNRASTGWESMLEGLSKAEFQITGTWPMRSERSARSRSLDSNALASSIVLVCRPRDVGARVTTRKEFLLSLKQELPHAIRNLQKGNIAPVDLAQAAIGPGMAVYSRYKKVLESDGETMRVRTALGLINQTLDEGLSEQESEFDPYTRWALAWFEQHAFDEGLYGEAEVLATSKALSVSALAEAGVLHSRGGKVRLLRRDELDDDWNPSSESRLTIWSVAQHLIRTLDKHDEAAAAALAERVGGFADNARDLAYRLYVLTERKGWAEEAGYYNSLVVSWPAIAPKAFALS